MAGGKPIKIAVLMNAQKAIAESNKLKGALGDLGDATGATKLKNGFKNVARGVAIGAGAAIAAVGALAVSTAKDLLRVERLGAQTEAVIKATGGAAGRSKAQVDKMATSLEGLTGVEAETVTEGQNMLLTFKNIKGDQFDAATKAALDMGVAMNKGSLQGLDLSKTSIQLGKALNDPVKGISALSKVGVSFNDQQKEQIKRMTEAGDVAGAQGVILKELQGEFGGAAKAAGQTTEGMIAKVQNSFGNIAEEVFAFILPLIQKIATWIQTKALPALQRFGDWMRSDGVVYVRQFGDTFQQNVLPILKTFGAFLTGTVVPAVVKLGGFLSRNRDFIAALAVSIGVMLAAWKAYVFFTQTVPAIIAAVTAAQKALNLAMKANVIGIVITAIAALVAGLIWFFTKTKTGQAIVKTAWAAIQTAIKAVTDWWQNTAWPTIQAVWNSIIGAFRQGKEKVAGFMKAALAVIKTVWKFTPLGFIVSNWTRIMDFFRSIPGKAKAIFTTAINFIKTIWKYTPLGLIVSNWGRIMDYFRSIPGKVKGIFGAAISWLKTAGKNILAGLKAGVVAGWAGVGSWLGGIAGRVKGAVGSLGSLLWGAGSAILSGFLSGLKSKWSAVTDFVGGIASWIKNNKGPLSYDRRLLTPAGRAIIDGLRKGLKGEVPKLRKVLRFVTDTIARTQMPTLVAQVDVAGNRLNTAMATQRAGVSQPSGQETKVTIDFSKPTGDPLFDALLAKLKEYIRVNGNNPATALKG